MPPKKCDKLARYREICGPADTQPPQLPSELTVANLPLPPLPLAQQEPQQEPLLPLLPSLPLAQEDGIQHETVSNAASLQSNEATAIAGELAAIGAADAEGMGDVLMEDLLPMVLGCEV
jgi:hypothetical protein